MGCRVREGAGLQGAGVRNGAVGGWRLAACTGFSWGMVITNLMTGHAMVFRYLVKIWRVHVYTWSRTGAGGKRLGIKA